MRALIKMNTMETAIVDVVLKRNIRGGYTARDIERDLMCSLNAAGGVNKVIKVHLLRN